MKSLTQVLVLLFISTAFSIIAMQDSAPATTIGGPIPPEKNIRLVFMGRTGAGKSTMVNAFYNFTKKIPWDEYPKLFPIPTEIQSCNVEDYMNRKVENLSNGQLNAITQVPSEYISKGQSFVLSLIDCPGMAESVEKDIVHTQQIAEFLVKGGDFNAICIVLPASLNRQTAETKYFVEQIKTIIPASAYNRIFILVTHTNTSDSNIESFVMSMDLPVKNVFYFDNFALSKDGHFKDMTIQADSEDEIEDPFDCPTDRSEKNSAANNNQCIKKVERTWKSSQKAFNAVLVAASTLGRFTSAEMQKIAQVKSSVTEKILAAHRKVKTIEDYELSLKLANLALEKANNDYAHAQQKSNSSTAISARAAAEKQAAEALSLYETYTREEIVKTPDRINTLCLICGVVCHPLCGLENRGPACTDHLTCCKVMKDGLCTVCPKKCHFTSHRHRDFIYQMVTRESENTDAILRRAEAQEMHIHCQGNAEIDQQDLKLKQQEKSRKSDYSSQLNGMLKRLREERKVLQQEIVSLYLELGEVSLSPINFHISEYYDICIRAETDSVKKERLEKDRRFYEEQILLYKDKDELKTVIQNNLVVIMRDHDSLREYPKNFKVFSEPTNQEYESYITMIFKTCKATLRSYGGRDPKIRQALANMNDTELRMYTLLSLHKMFEG